MKKHQDLEPAELHRFIKSGAIQLGGNANLKIYGRLDCKSGKRMLKKNRVFFASEVEAIEEGYRPCGHCMITAYQLWKTTQKI